MKQYVVRRAIKSLSEDKILGYELLFQEGRESLYGTENAAADTIVGFLMDNSAKIFKDDITFLTFTPQLLLRNTPKIFRKDKIVIQIGDNLIIHPLAMPIIKKYYSEGYKFAINDFKFTPKYFGILEYADYIRIQIKSELTDKEKESLENIVRMTQGFDKVCIATDIDTKEAYDTALSLGVDYVEGAHVAETMTQKADKVEYMQGNFFRLVAAVAKEEPDMAEIEDIINMDAGLTYTLLKLVNSAYFALRNRTASVRQAIMMMGIGRMRQWVNMLSLKSNSGEGASEILRMSFLRAKFAEMLSQRVPNCPIVPSEAYMMGMFSTFVYMVDATMEELLAEIPVGDEIKAALIKGEGVAGAIANIVVCYEKADWKGCQEIAEQLEMDVNELSQMYIDCVEEVSDIWESLTTEAARSGEARLFDDGDSSKLEDALV